MKVDFNLFQANYVFTVSNSLLLFCSGIVRRQPPTLSDPVRTYSTRNVEESHLTCAVFSHSDIRFQSHQS